MSIFLFVPWSVCLLAHLRGCPITCLSSCLFVCLVVCLCVKVSVCATYFLLCFFPTLNLSNAVDFSGVGKHAMLTTSSTDNCTSKCNGWKVRWNGTTTVPKSVLRYVVDKVRQVLISEA